MEWGDFNGIFDILVQYYFGTYSVLSLVIVAIVLILFIANGIAFKYSILLTFPLLGFFFAIGWFGTVANSQWIINLALIVIALLYSYVIIKMMG